MYARPAAMPDRIAGLRRWAEAALFRAALPAGPLSVNRVLLGVGLAVAGVVVVLLRLGGDPLGFVWAEDGGVFLQQAFNAPVPDAIFTNYAGYLHVVPRLLAELAAALPIEWSSEVLALSGSVVVVLSAYAVWRASAPHLPDPLLRGMLAAMVLLLPVVGFETLANITYLQWLMVFAAFWLLLWRPPSWRAAIGASGFVALTLASAPLALLLAPIAVLRAVVLRDRADTAITVGFAGGAVIQVVAILADGSAQPPPGWDPHVVSAYLVRVVGGVAFGQHADGVLWEHAPTLLLASAALLFVAVAALVIARQTPARSLSLIALVLSVGLFVIADYQRDLGDVLLWPDGQSHTFGARYTILPALFLLTAVVLELQHPPRRWRDAARARLRLGTVGVISVATLSTFYVGNFGRSTVGWSDVVDQAREACAGGASLAPDLLVSLPDFHIDVPCRRL